MRFLGLAGLFSQTLFFGLALLFQALSLKLLLFFLQRIGGVLGRGRTLADLALFARSRSVFGGPKFGVDRLGFGAPLENKREADEKQRVHGDSRQETERQIEKALIADSLGALIVHVIPSHQRRDDSMRSARPTRSILAACSAFMTSITCS